MPVSSWRGLEPHRADSQKLGAVDDGSVPGVPIWLCLRAGPPLRWETHAQHLGDALPVAVDLDGYDGHEVVALEARLQHVEGGRGEDKSGCLDGKYAVIPSWI